MVMAISKSSLSSSDDNDDDEESSKIVYVGFDNSKSKTHLVKSSATRRVEEVKTSSNGVELLVKAPCQPTGLQDDRRGLGG
jgi:hypothetical protein